MKLHFLSAHQKIGHMRKSLGRADGTSRAYPLAGQITTYEENFDIAVGGVNEYRDILARHALIGHALYKGLFTRPLVSESRRGMSDKNAKTELLVLDIDGLELDSIKALLGAKGKDVEAVAEMVIDLLPAALQDVSYVALASASFGLKDKEVSVHIHFLLEEPVAHRALKDWLISLNYTQQAIFERLKLTGSKMQLKSVVDPCLAEPSRIVYITAPEFGPRLTNPFKGHDHERIIAVTKKKPLLDLNDELSRLSEKQGIVDARKGDHLKELQKKAGVDIKKLQTTRMNVGGNVKSVVTNPPPMRLDYAYDDAEFVRYNLSGKTGAAHWVAKSCPEVVQCFIPDEPSFLFRAADAQSYAEHVEKYGGTFERVVDKESGIVREVTRSMYQARGSDQFISLEYDQKNDEIVELEEHGRGDTAANWLKHYGYIVPDPVPPVYLVMEPSEQRTIYNEGDKSYINRFEPTQFMKSQELAHNAYSLRYGNAWLIHHEAPIICEIILNMLGDDLDCFEHFTNWLAYIFQSRSKADTAWLIHGLEGTGKGLFFKAVVQKLFGPKYAVQNTLQGIADDPFNGWLEDVMVLMVDEFNMKGGSSMTKTASLLKNMITEPTIMLRKMQQQQRSVTQRVNMIFATNDLDAMSVSDRRRYNMAPRQQRMLEARLPQIKKYRDQYDALIAAELAPFAAALRSFKVNRGKASSILENAARIETQKAGMNAVDSFFESITKGDFSSFIEILDRPLSNLEPKEMNQLMRVRTFLTACLGHVNTGKPCYLHKDDLRSLYGYLANKETSNNAFGRMMNSHQLTVRRTMEPVGATTKLSTRPSCIETTWTYDDEEVLTHLKAHNRALPGQTVESITKPETQEELRERLRAESEAVLAQGEPNTHQKSW
jgi:hypothetical protein